MDLRRKTVTALTLIVSLVFFGCEKKRPKTAVELGNAKIASLNSTEATLSSEFAIELRPLVIDGSERNNGVESNGRDYQWIGVSKARQEKAKRLLEQYVAQANEVLAIGSLDKKVVVTDREQIIARRDAALAFLKSLAAIQPLIQPGYEPKPGTKPPYEHSVEI